MGFKGLGLRYLRVYRNCIGFGSGVLTESFERKFIFLLFIFGFSGAGAWAAWPGRLAAGWYWAGWPAAGWLAGLGWAGLWFWRVGACKAGPALPRHTISIYPVLRV